MSAVELFSKQLIEVAQAALSGFIAAWVFYGLTAHPKTSPFERIVQALIFTALVRVPLICLEFCFWWVGKYLFSVGRWTKEVDFLWSMLLALPVGFLVAWAANKDIPHRRLRKWGITKKHSYPSVWYHVFNDDTWPPWAVLHLKPGKNDNARKAPTAAGGSPRKGGTDDDGGKVPRRLYGWILEWPDQPENGHFVIQQAEWLNADNTSIRLDGVDRLLIPTSEVEMVEFVKFVEEPATTKLTKGVKNGE